MHVSRLVFSAALAATLAGCAGGRAPVVPARPAGTFGSASFTIHWPSPAARASQRRPKWISPSAKSVVVEINNDASLTTIANDPGTGGTSTVSVKAPAGSDAITFSVYDGAGGTGAEVGQKTITATIAAGTATTVAATIDGIVAAVDFTPLPGQPNVQITSRGSSRLALLGDLAATFVATPKDADGNVILGPGDPIDFTAQSVDSTLEVAPVPGHADQFTVRPSQAAPGDVAHVTIRASDAVGGYAQSSIDLGFLEMAYVAYQNAGTGTLTALDDKGIAVALPGAFPGLTQPVSVAYDADDHRLFAADAASGSVFAYNTDGTAVSGYTPPVVSGASAVLYDYNDKLLYVASAANTIAVFHSDGSPATVAGTFDNLSGPVGLGLVPVRGAYYISAVNAAAKTITSYNEDGTTAFNNIGNPDHPVISVAPLVPSGVAIVDSVIFVSGNDGVSDQVVPWGLAGRALAPITDGLSGPAGATYDPLQSLLYVANATSGTISVYSGDLSSGWTNTNQIPAPAGFAKPVAIVITP